MSNQNPQGMTDKQFAFCQLLRSDPDRIGWKAYKGAYPSCKTVAGAEVNASKLLRNTKVRLFLEEQDKESLARVEITVDMVNREKARIAFFNPKNLFHPTGELKKIHEMDDDTAAALVQLEIDIKPGDTKEDVLTLLAKVKWQNKVPVLDQLSKQLGQYEKDNAQKEGSGVVGLLGMRPEALLEHVLNNKEAIQINMQINNNYGGNDDEG